MAKIKDDNELRSYWNGFSSNFSKYFEPTTTITAHSLFLFLKMNTDITQKVLDIGCGSGGPICLANHLRGSGTSLTAIDLSPEMINISQKKFNELNDKLNKEPVTFHQGSAMELPFESASFDKAYGNYIFHLVPDPLKAISEARRILKDDGILAFSVWGRIENSPKFSIHPPILERLKKEFFGEDTEPVRSSFHMSDIESTKKMVLSAGFSKVLAWYQDEPMPVLDGDEYATSVINSNPHLVNFYQRLNQDQQKIFYNEVKNQAQKLLSEGQIIKSEALIVIAFV